MTDVALIALLTRRLGLVEQFMPTNSFDADSLRAVLATMPEDVRDLPEGDSPSRAALVERLQLLGLRAQTEHWEAEGLHWRLQDVLRTTLNQLR